MGYKSNARKIWLKSLKSEIMGLRYEKLSDQEIRKKMRLAFYENSTRAEIAVGFGLWLIILALVGFGIHISYAVLMWEMHLYEFSVHFSPYTSMLIFVLLCVVLCGILLVWFRYFVDWFRFHKILDDTLDEQFYLKMLRALLFLGLVGFVILMIIVFFVALQISEFYGIPLGKSLLETFMEIID